MQTQDQGNYVRLKPFSKGFLTDLCGKVQPVDKPITEKQIQEADEAGLDCLSKSTDPNLNLYRFRECGHEKYLQPTHVRKKNFKCTQCQTEKLISTLSQKGIKHLGRVGKKHLIERQCKHIDAIHLPDVENNNFSKCNQCFHEEILYACKQNGYDFIKDEGACRKTVKFKSCGHHKTAHFSQIFKGNLVCKECKKQKHEDFATKQGMKVLEKVDNHYSKYELPCGHVKTLRRDHVEDESWLCSDCEESSYSQPSHLYLLKISHPDFTWLKLGYAKNLKVRRTGYMLSNLCKVEELLVVPVDTRKDALEVERGLHKKYKSKGLPKSLMRKFHTANGHTECYPLEMQSILLQELENVKESECPTN